MRELFAQGYSRMADRTIICKCGQWNRLKGLGSAKGYFSCAKCGARLYDGNPHTGASGKRWAWLALALLAAAGVLFPYIMIVNTPRTQIAQNPSSPADLNEFDARHVLEGYTGDHQQARSRGGSVAQAPKPTAQLQNQATSVEPQPKPPVPATTHDPKNDLVPVKIETGIIWRKRKGGEVCPLTIEADAGNYAIELVDSKSNNGVLMIFVGAHQTFATKVRLGTYKISAPVAAFGMEKNNCSVRPRPISLWTVNFSSSKTVIRIWVRVSI